MPNGCDVVDLTLESEDEGGADEIKKRISRQNQGFKNQRKQRESHRDGFTALPASESRNKVIDLSLDPDDGNGIVAHYARSSHERIPRKDKREKRKISNYFTDHGPPSKKRKHELKAPITPAINSVQNSYASHSNTGKPARTIPNEKQHVPIAPPKYPPLWSRKMQSMLMGISEEKYQLQAAAYLACAYQLAGKSEMPPVAKLEEWDRKFSLAVGPHSGPLSTAASIHLFFSRAYNIRDARDLLSSMKINRLGRFIRILDLLSAHLTKICGQSQKPWDWFEYPYDQCDEDSGGDFFSDRDDTLLNFDDARQSSETSSDAMKSTLFPSTTKLHLEFSLLWKILVNDVRCAESSPLSLRWISEIDAVKNIVSKMVKCWDVIFSHSCSGCAGRHALGATGEGPLAVGRHRPPPGLPQLRRFRSHHRLCWPLAFPLQQQQVPL